jgi:F-type H+-transporting ATPase subunit c
MMLPLAEISTAAVGAGFTIVGAGIGIGMVFFSGLQSMARQPELQSKLQTQMLIGAAFIEGTALFALVICLMKG